MYRVLGAYHRGMVVWTIIAALVLAGCGGNHSAPVITPATGTLETGVEQAGATAGGPAGLPVDGFVDPAEISARRGSLLAEQQIPGNEVFQAGPGITVDTDAGLALLQPGDDATAWTMYRFTDLLADDSNLVLSLVLDTPEAQRLYLGISNYELDRWDWTLLDSPDWTNNLSLPVAGPVISDGGCLYAIVVCSAPDTARISAMELERDVRAPAPLGLTASNGTYPGRIELTWTDPAETYEELTCDGVLIERRPVDGDWLQLDVVPAGDDTYLDDEYNGDATVYGQEYDYRIHTVVDGLPGPPGLPATGCRRLQDVTGVTASNAIYPDYIRLRWNTVEDATGYVIQVLYNGEWREVTDLSGGGYYYYDHYWDYPAGIELEFATEYEYRIRARWKGYYSDSWTSTTGSRGLAPAANISATDGGFPDRVELTWDPVPYCTGYEVGYSPDGGALTLLASLDGYANSAFNHTYESPAGHECELETVYTYWVRPLYGDEKPAWDMDNCDTGFRRVQPPQGATATDGTIQEHVLVSWEPPAGISDFEVYRDGTAPGNLIATVNDTGEYTDPVPDYDEHTYYVVSLWQGIPSEPGTPDTGYRMLFEVSQVSEDDSSWIDLAEVDGRPAITSSRAAERGVWFNLADDTAPAGPADWQGHLILDCEAAAKSRIAVFAGRPAVLVAGSLMEYTNSITYSYSAVAAPAAATDWATHEILDHASPLMDAVLGSINGTPALCYHDTTGYYYLSATADPPVDITDWESSRLRQHCYYPSLVEYNGVPVLVGSALYALDRVLDLNVLIGQTATPASSGWDAHIRGEGCVSNAIAVVGGRLAGACRNGDSRLSYARALVDAPAADTDWAGHEIDDCRAIRGSGFLIECGGFPAVAYTTAAADGIYLKVAIGTTATPDSAADWAVRKVDLAPEISQWVIAEIDGRLAVAYLKADEDQNPQVYYAAAVE